MTVAPATQLATTFTQTAGEGRHDAVDRLVVEETAKRAQRWLWRSQARRRGIQPVGRVVGCGKAAAGHIALGTDASGGGHAVGLATCQSVHSCPVCSPVIRQSRAADLAGAIERHQADGGEVFFVTLTQAHNAGMSYAEARGRLGRTWRRFASARCREGWRNDIGGDDFLGDVRAFDVTHGGNGWHPHYHVVLFVPAGVTKRDVLGTWRRCDGCSSSRCTGMHPTGFVQRWIDKSYSVLDDDGALAGKHRSVKRFRRDAGRGCDVQHCRRGQAHDQALAMYAMKAGLELYRHDLKVAGKGASPWQLLGQAIDEGKGSRAANLWAEYATEMQGKHASQWSQDLHSWWFKDGRRDESDQERAKGRLDQFNPAAYLTAKVWNGPVRHRGLESELISAAANGKVWEAAARLGIPLIEPSRKDYLNCEHPIAGPAWPKQGAAHSAGEQHRAKLDQAAGSLGIAARWAWYSMDGLDRWRFYNRFHSVTPAPAKRNEDDLPEAIDIDHATQVQLANQRLGQALAHRRRNPRRRRRGVIVDDGHGDALGFVQTSLMT